MPPQGMSTEQPGFNGTLRNAKSRAEPFCEHSAMEWGLGVSLVTSGPINHDRQIGHTEGPSFILAVFLRLRNSGT